MTSLRIESCSFGAITVGERTYRSDLIVLGDRVIPDWFRQEGHRLCEADLAKVLQWEPELIVVGTGAFGRMEVPSTLRERLAAMGIQVRTARSPEAATIYNAESQEGRRVAGAFHLTC